MSDDADLVASARRREPAAWRLIYERHAPAVRRVCLGFGQLSRADVEDALQETFVRAFENLAKLREPQRLKPWLLTIARSRCLNRLQSQRSVARASAAFAADPTVGQPSGGDVRPHLDREHRIQLVRELIEALPPGPEAETVRLFYLEGELSAREIAERMGVGKSAITMRLERFRARIKTRLAALMASAEEGQP